MRRFNGFSLVEVLVALVVLSIGLIGTAKLTANSLKSTNSSLYRSQATFLANDILDRMRANLTSARAGDYNTDLGPTYSAVAGTLALYDCQEWVTTLATSLPQGQGIVVVDNNGIATITVQWDVADADHQFITNAQL